jgi:hypothetical protein
VENASGEAVKTMLDYSAARDRIQTGDIGFSGDPSFTSWIIRKATDSVISHAWLYVWLRAAEFSVTTWTLCAFETSFDALGRVEIDRMSRKIAEAQREGRRVYWVRPKRGITPAGVMWLFAHQDSAYAYWKAIASVIPWLRERETFRTDFCSELVTGEMQNDIPPRLPRALKATKVTPQRLAEFALYQPEYFQLTGPDMEISRFNSVEP